MNISRKRRRFPNALKKIQIDSIYIYLVLQINESKFENRWLVPYILQVIVVHADIGS